jgi:hypothetical protein
MESSPEYVTIFQLNPRTHRPGEPGAGAGQDVGERRAVQCPRQVDKPALVVACGRRQQDGLNGDRSR